MNFLWSGEAQGHVGELVEGRPLQLVVVQVADRVARVEKVPEEEEMSPGKREREIDKV